VLTAFTVGKAHPTVPPPIPEGGRFNWSRDGLELFLSVPSPSGKEVDDAAKGESEFAFATLPESPDVLWFFYRMGSSWLWSDAPYTPHLMAAEDQPDASLFTEEQRLLLNILLADSRTAIVLAIRAVSLSPDFSRDFAESLRSLMLRPWCGRQEYDRQIARAYQHYPDTASMFRLAKHRTKGGA